MKQFKADVERYASVEYATRPENRNKLQIINRLAGGAISEYTDYMNIIKQTPSKNKINTTIDEQAEIVRKSEKFVSLENRMNVYI